MSAPFESLTGVTLLDPWMLVLALLLPVASWVRRRSRAPAVVFAPAALFAGRRLPRSGRVLFLALPRTLQALGLLLVVVALARPVQRDRLPLSTEGIDILLCVDASSSMTSNDMDAARTRLEVAKDAAARFVADREHDRIGLVRFARYPDVRCPPTLDHEALLEILAEVETVPADGPEDATGIGTAVARAAQALHGGAAASKVVILLTDGEENVATADKPREIAPLHAAQLCERLGVRVYTIAAGIGRPAIGGGGASGGIVPLDTTQVEQMSARTGGRFFAARDAAAVDGVYAAIDALERVELAAPRYRLVERFLPFLVLGLGFLLTSRVLETTVLDVLP